MTKDKDKQMEKVGMPKRPAIPEKEKSPPASTAAKQRSLQKSQDRSDKKKESSDAADTKGSLQAGLHDQPVVLPSQRLSKPGQEADMKLAPRFQAPDYRGSKKLEGMAAIVTGGDSGIGRAVAVLFAREGANIAIVYLNEHDDARETQQHVEAEGRQCVLIPGDVKDRGFCHRAVEQTLRSFNRLDLLVNNAAFQEHADSLAELTTDRLEETFHTNIFGYFNMATAVVPHLQNGSAIINTGSVVGLRGSGHLMDYAATKGAIHAFTKSLAKNLMKSGIRVNAVAPGPVWTPLNPADGPQRKLSSFGRDTDMGRAAQPEEIAPAFVFLAAPCCASYISGIVLPVTGSVDAI